MWRVCAPAVVDTIEANRVASAIAQIEAEWFFIPQFCRNARAIPADRNSKPPLLRSLLRRTGLMSGSSPSPPARNPQAMPPLGPKDAWTLLEQLSGED
jgi:hypothetical protein